MKNWKFGIVALGLGTLVFAAGCSGRVNKVFDSDPVTMEAREIRCNLSPAVCDNAPAYDDAQRLIMSPNSMDVGFTVDPDIADSPQSNPAMEVDEFRTAAGNGLMLADEIISLDSVRVSQQQVVYCTDYSTCANTVSPLGYDYYIRSPGAVAYTDDDIVMSRFIVLRTPASSGHIAFGVAAAMGHSEELSAGVQRYRPEQTGAFVSGPRFNVDLPQSGLAAYVGFANAYAESSNRNFLPFQAATNHGGSNFGTGQSAMVFEFTGAGAKFRHGFMDLFGTSFVDRGELVKTDTNLPERNAIIMGLEGRFNSPEFIDNNRLTPIGSYAGDVDTAPRASGYEDNPNYEFDIGNRQGSEPGLSSGLAFRLMANDATEDEMDFTVVLARYNIGDGSRYSTGSYYGGCYTPNAQINCLRNADSAGGGVVRLYGGAADLTTNTGADGAPTFAAGVWNYSGLIYVDRNGSGNADDELYGVVNLIGSIGGLIYDADPGTLPTP